MSITYSETIFLYYILYIWCNHFDLYAWLNSAFERLPMIHINLSTYHMIGRTVACIQQINLHTGSLLCSCFLGDFRFVLVVRHLVSLKMFHFIPISNVNSQSTHRHHWMPLSSYYPQPNDHQAEFLLQSQKYLVLLYNATNFKRIQRIWSEKRSMKFGNWKSIS